MNVALWVCQALLCAVFLFSSTQKAFRSKPALIASGQTGVKAYSVPFIRFIATAELLGSLGLILPQALGVMPVLTPLAAAGLALIMVGAAFSHWRLHEPRNIAINGVLLAMCLFVLAGRMVGA